MNKYASLEKKLKSSYYLSSRNKDRNKMTRMLLSSSIKKYHIELYDEKYIFFASFSTAVVLYFQAIECYKYDLFEAAAVMCRDAIDAALLSTKLFKNYRVTQSELENVVKLLKFGELEMALLERIKESGNFSASLG